MGSDRQRGQMMVEAALLLPLFLFLTLTVLLLGLLGYYQIRLAEVAHDAARLAAIGGVPPDQAGRRLAAKWLPDLPVSVQGYRIAVNGQPAVVVELALSPSRLPGGRWVRLRARSVEVVLP